MNKNIVVITAHPAPYWDKSLTEIGKLSNVSVIYIKQKVAYKPWGNQVFYQGIYFKLSNFYKIFGVLLKSNQIILGGIYMRELRFLLFISLIFNKKVALFSDVPEVKNRNKFLIYFKKQLYKSFNLFLISGSKGIELYHSLYGIEKNKMIYFPYGWDDGDVINVDFNKNPFQVFISNRFLDRKGYDVLLDAIIELQKKNILGMFNFRIAGNGPMFDFYKNKFEKISNLNCVFLGWIGYKDYVIELDNCQIFIHASKFEPFGVPLLDALQRGKIVVSSNAVMSGVDFILNKKNGFLYESSNALELAIILKDISKNTYDLNYISVNAKNTLKDFSDYIKVFTDKVN